jgi:two-component system, cell cycle sensor histidine kinase and response regulator CckA
MMPQRVLIIDDDMVAARDLEARLTRRGYIVPAIASSAEEGIAVAREIRPDLVLIDMALEGGTQGIQAAWDIRRNQIPVIYLTADSDPKTLALAKDTETFGCLITPFSERELVANVEMALYKHRVEKRIRKMERWVVSLVNEVAEGVVEADGHGMITFINPAAEAITRWPREQAVGRKLGDVLRLVKRRSGEPVALDGLDEGPVVSLGEETMLLDRENEPISVESTTSFIRDESQRPNGTVSVLREVAGARHGALVALGADVTLASTQAVTVQGMLQLCAESMVRHLQAAFARIWTLNTAGDTLLLQASAGMYTHLDGPHGKVPVGMYKIGMIAQERKPHLTNDVLNDERVSDREWARREGMVAFAGYPLIIDGRLVGVAAMFSRRPLSDSVFDSLASISSAIAVGLERKRLEEQLRQSQKMEAIGLLAGGVAHDFNNLLTVISGYSQLLLMGKPALSEEMRLQVMEIGKAGESAASLTRQLLAFGRKQVMELRPLDLNALVTGMEKMLRRLIGEDIVLATSLESRVGAVVGDAGQLEQVIVNLAVNARDAMPQGGKLLLETGNVVLDEVYAERHHGVKAGHYAMIAVTDTGVGMTAEVLSHIFEPFYTTKGPGKGTGLGLSTVYGIIQQVGGHLGVYSEPGIGTSFKIYLPPTDAPIPPVESEPEEGMPFGVETVLLVEDEDGVRALGRYVLQTCGYIVLEAANGREALEIAGRHVGRIDLLVTDVVMPEVQGRALAEQLTDARPETRVLYISGHTDDAVIRHGVLSAETHFLQKPFTPSGLAHKVREVLDGHPAPRAPETGAPAV